VDGRVSSKAGSLSGREPVAESEAWDAILDQGLAVAARAKFTQGALGVPE
jgi:hypothetical protein